LQPIPISTESKMSSNEANIVVPANIKRYFDRVCEKSIFFDAECESNLAKFQLIELLPGRILGRGGFCKVSEITRIAISGESTNSDEKEENSNASRTHMASNYIREGDARYAIKILRKDLDRQDTLKGIFDLALEAKFLAVIDHPHIIKIRAVALSEYLSKDFFVILDRLYNTLEKQIEIWSERKKKMNGNVSRLLDFKGKKKKTLLVEKLNVAYDIVSAVSHLHENSIIYRDLATDNIGFDVRGQVKIFDFGLAKELLPSLKLDDGNYKLTGYTGSLRYMAPEVVLMKPYNAKADVFGFGVLFWQMYSCDIPYDGFTVPMYEKIVVGNGYRPPVKSSWPRELSDIMVTCWSTNPRERPDLEEVRSRVKMFVLGQQAGNQIEFDVDDLSQRSAVEQKSK